MMWWGKAELEQNQPITVNNPHAAATIAKLMDRIDQLEQRLQVLEQQLQRLQIVAVTNEGQDD